MPVGETIKMVGIRKNPNEPLGLTVEQDDYNQLVVARILAGGMIDRQGLLNKGDVILEVNGVAVSSPEDLQSEISRAKESVTLKIGPNVDDEMKSARLTATGGSQVKNKTQEAGKKLAVSLLFCFTLFFK
jgi:MAGUK p55 subfamily member 2/6